MSADKTTRERLLIRFLRTPCGTGYKYERSLSIVSVNCTESESVTNSHHFLEVYIVSRKLDGDRKVGKGH